MAPGCQLYTAFLVLTLAVSAEAKPRTLAPGQHSLHRITCDFPVRLTRDCSPWQGATRPIAFADYRMAVAADGAGRTILLSGLRRGPDHNGHMFSPPMETARAGQRAREAIHRIGQALERRGFALQRVQPLHRGQRVKAYILEFSANVYDYLKQFTVLESEHWLPDRKQRR